MIKIYIAGREPSGLIVEALRAIHLKGESVQVVAEPDSAAYAIASAPDSHVTLLDGPSTVGLAVDEGKRSKKGRKATRPRWRR